MLICSHAGGRDGAVGGEALLPQGLSLSHVALPAVVLLCSPECLQNVSDSSNTLKFHLHRGPSHSVQFLNNTGTVPRTSPSCILPWESEEIIMIDFVFLYFNLLAVS